MVVLIAGLHGDFLQRYQRPFVKRVIGSRHLRFIDANRRSCTNVRLHCIASVSLFRVVKWLRLATVSLLHRNKICAETLQKADVKAFDKSINPIQFLKTQPLKFKVTSRPKLYIDTMICVLVVLDFTLHNPCTFRICSSL